MAVGTEKTKSFIAIFLSFPLCGRFFFIFFNYNMPGRPAPDMRAQFLEKP
jgi:hypothetical protein